MVGYILKNSDEGDIAVIAGKVTPTEDELNEFWVRVRLAIAEHFCCDPQDVSINDIENNWRWTFGADTMEDNEECIRSFELIQTAIYLDISI